MSVIVVNSECIPQQIKVFTKWVQSHLSKLRTNVKIKDVTKDLCNGVALVELAETLVDKLAPRNWTISPRLTEDMIQNCDLALEMFNEDGVHFIGISGKDVNENDEKLILNLVWTLILHYSIGISISTIEENNAGSSNATTSEASQSLSANADLHPLLQWAIYRTSNYSNINDFQPYSLAMCALLDSYAPDRVNYDSLEPNDTERNSKLAISVMRELKIPVLLDTDDLQNTEIDEKALLTQLSVIRIVLEKIKRPKTLKSTTASIIEEVQETHLNDEIKVIDRGIELEPELEIIPDVEEQVLVHSRSFEFDPEFFPHTVEGDNSQYSGRRFGLIMTLKDSDYNNGHKRLGSPSKNQVFEGEDIQFALTLTKDDNPYLNPSGRMLDITKPNIENDPYQQFTFGLNKWSTVIDSFISQGMVWDVSDEENLNPPAGTPFYVFPFHGRHNQHFIYRDGMIYAQQNGHVVTYVGGDEPLVMMAPSKSLKARQTFSIQLL